MSGPTLTIVIPVEGRPLLYLNVTNEAEQVRLTDWIEANDDIADLVAHARTVAENRKQAA